MALSIREIYNPLAQAVLLSVFWVGPSVEAFAQTPGVQTGNGTQGYKPATGILWNLALKPEGTVAFDKDGNLAYAGPIKFDCKGHPLELIDGLVKDGWLETKDFGRIHIRLKPDQELLVSETNYDKFINNCNSK